MSEERNINYKVLEKIAVIGVIGDHITTELRLVEYGDYKPKLDLRRWRVKDDNEIPLKGLTLDIDEAKALNQALTDYLGAER